MVEFRHYSPEDLAAEESFRRWVLFDSPAESIFWEEWVKSNPDRLALVIKAKKILKASEHVFNQVTEDEVACELDRLSAAIGHTRGEQPRFRPPILSKWYFAAASVLFLLSSIVWILWYESPRHDLPLALDKTGDKVSVALKQEINTGSVSRIVYLEDGSTVILQPGSQLRYPGRFNGTGREVYLKGEAFFEVVKNPAKPFIVYAGALATKVLGTSFKVSAPEKDKYVTVVVKTGRVSVFPVSQRALNGRDEPGQKEGMVLTPNQKVVYAADESRLTRSLVQEPEIIGVTVPGISFNFRSTPIREVLNRLSDAYGVAIIFDEEAMKNCYLTAILEDEPLFEKIDLICKTIGADFEQMDGNIILNGQGCN